MICSHHAEVKAHVNLIESWIVAMDRFSRTIETSAKMRRATPTVSGMQRARRPRGNSPLLFRLFNRGDCQAGNEAVAEKKRFACSEKTCANNRREQAKYQADYQAKLQVGIRRLYCGTPRNRCNFVGCACANFFAAMKMRFGTARENRSIFG
jgi:hypothetical protein